MGKPLLVLDMDNTLVFSTTNLALHNYGFDVAGEDGEPLHVIKRPGLDEFLRRVAKVYRVVVYSAGMDDYVNEVVDKLDPERKLVYKRYSASDCEICNCKTCKGGKVKNLKARAKDLGLDFSRLVWVDDVPGYFEHCKENGIQISKFEGEEDDSALQVLCPVLVALAKLKDFRRAIALYRAGQLKFEAGRLLELDAFTEDWVPVTCTG